MGVPIIPFNGQTTSNHTKLSTPLRSPIDFGVHMPFWHPLVPWATETTEHGNKFRARKQPRKPTETTEKTETPLKHLQKAETSDPTHPWLGGLGGLARGTRWGPRRALVPRKPTETRQTPNGVGGAMPGRGAPPLPLPLPPSPSASPLGLPCPAKKTRLT